MNKLLLLTIISLLNACSITGSTTEKSSSQSDEYPPINATSVKSECEVINPSTTSVATLLANRQAWCLLPDAERLQVDAVLSTQKNNASILQRLILSSCSPAQYAKQSQALIKSVDTSLLSEDERSLLNLIDTANRSILHTQQERDKVSKKLQQTIDGISDIEAQINKDAPQQPRGQP